MVDFLKIVKQRSLFSEITYYLLNIGLVVVLLVMSQTIQSPVLAIALVLLSKWRMFLVRPRYWRTNILSNMVDIIVGVSIVTLMYLPDVHLFAQVALAFQYAVWLVLIKPLSKRWHMLLQAFIAVVYGVTALYSVSYEWPVVLVVLGMFIIGYSTSRHFLFSYEEQQIVFLSAIWGLMLAEIGWLAYYWTFSYSLPFTDALKVPQVTIIVAAMFFLAGKVYKSWNKNKRIVVGEVVLPAVFSGLLVCVIFIFFNKVVI